MASPAPEQRLCRAKIIVTLAVNQQDKLYGRRILRLGFIYRGQSRPRSASIRHAFGVQFVFSSRLLRALAEQV